MHHKITPVQKSIRFITLFFVFISSTLQAQDTEVPSTPTALLVNGITATSISLNWNESSDNIGVTGYKLYIDGSNPIDLVSTNAVVGNLASNTNYTFTVSSFDAAGNISPQSDSVNVTTLDSNSTVVIDNTDAQCTFDSTWSSSTSTPPYYGSNYHHDGSSGADSNTRWAQWTPTIVTSGLYNIYMWWTAHPNRPDAAPVQVAHNGGLDTSLTVNQQTNGGQWNYLGTYALDTGNSHYVKIIASDNGYTIADAVMFERIVTDTEAPSIPTGLTSSNLTPSTVDLDWTMSTDNTGVAGYKIYTNGTNPISTTSTSITLTELSPNTYYTFSVSAFDAAGNESALSSAINITTPTETSGNTFSLMLDFGPTAPGSTQLTNSPGHETNLIDSGEDSWNIVGTTSQLSGTVTGLIYADGSSAAGVSFRYGASLLNSKIIDFSNAVDNSNALGTVANTGIYTSGSVARDGIWEGSGSSNDYSIGIRIDGLEAGDYTVLIMARNTNSASSSGTAMDLYALADSSATSFNFSNESALNISNSDENTWIEGSNYGSIDVTLASGQSLYIIADGSVSTANRGFLNAIQIISQSGAPSDNQAPSIPDGLLASNITTSSIDLDWNPSSDNTEVTGYKVYTNGANPVSVTGTSATISGLSPDTNYSFSVSAYDAANNESSQSSSLNILTDSAIVIDETDGFYNLPIGSSLSGIFTAEFDAISSLSPSNALIGLSSSIASTYGDIATIVRFGPSGNIDARNGSNYSADTTVPYSSSVSYHFRLVINVNNHTYSIYVTPEGGTEQIIGVDYAFRSEQSSASSLAYWTAHVSPEPNRYLTLSGFNISGGSTDTETPLTPTGLSATNITSSTVDLDWNATTDNIGVAGYRVYINGNNPVDVNTTSVTVSGLSPETSYSFSVSAYDIAGNESNPSSSINITTGTSTGTEYYVDPAAGNMNNPGTSTQPWSTLEAVFTAGKTFNTGDVIYLRNGYHGFPTITGNPSGQVTIQAQNGHFPTVSKVLFDNASHFTLDGLEVSPSVINTYDLSNYFITLKSNCSNLIVRNCLIYSEDSISGWTTSDWGNKAGKGISLGAPDSEVSNNLIYNIKYGISMTANATGSKASYNTIQNFSGDAMRTLGNYQILEYNLIMDTYDVDSNHRDGIQSYTVGSGGVGTATIYGTELRGNIIISYTDSSRPYLGTLQGIGCFDGYFEDWVIENNIICVDQWHGITFLGAINCRIINNTVVENPIGAASPSPWIGVWAHKDGTPSSGNVVRNNLTHDLNIDAASLSGTILDSNIVTSNYTAHFVDYANFDFHLKSTSSAIEAGNSNLAPTVDFEGDLRDVGSPDIGADEY